MYIKRFCQGGVSIVSYSIRYFGKQVHIIIMYLCRIRLAYENAALAITIFSIERYRVVKVL